jgi:hypothetical protein
MKNKIRKYRKMNHRKVIRKAIICNDSIAEDNLFSKMIFISYWLESDMYKKIYFSLVK